MYCLIVIFFAVFLLSFSKDVYCLLLFIVRLVISPFVYSFFFLLFLPLELLPTIARNWSITAVGAICSAADKADFDKVSWLLMRGERGTEERRRVERERKEGRTRNRGCFSFLRLFSLIILQYYDQVVPYLIQALKETKVGAVRDSVMECLSLIGIFFVVVAAAVLATVIVIVTSCNCCCCCIVMVAFVAACCCC